MIFNIAEVIKEWLAGNNRDLTDESMHAKMLAKNEEERERKKMEELQLQRTKLVDIDDELDRSANKPVSGGTPLTKETFATWLDKFVAENEAERRRLDLKMAAENTPSKHQDTNAEKITGREYFERLAASNAASGLSKDQQTQEDVEVNEEYYMEEGDIEYSDLDSDSDDE